MATYPLSRIACLSAAVNRIILLFIMVCLTVGIPQGVIAQITITKSDLENAIGQSFTFIQYQLEDLTGNEAGIQTLLNNQGDNKTWDFSQLSGYQEVGITTSEFLSLPLDPPPPGASDTLVLHATYVVKTYEPGMEHEAVIELMDTYQLSPVYPNPFNPQAQFTLTVAQEQKVRIDVFDALGRQVAVLHNGRLPGASPQHFIF